MRSIVSPSSDENYFYVPSFPALENVTIAKSLVGLACGVVIPDPTTTLPDFTTTTTPTPEYDGAYCLRTIPFTPLRQFSRITRV